MSPRSADITRLVMPPQDRRYRWVLTGRTPVKPARGHGWPLQACPNRYQETRIRASRRKRGSEGACPLQKKQRLGGSQKSLPAEGSYSQQGHRYPAEARHVPLPKAAINLEDRKGPAPCRKNKGLAAAKEARPPQVANTLGGADKCIMRSLNSLIQSRPSICPSTH